MEGDELDSDVRESRGERPGRHEEEGGGRACLVGLADWGLDGGGSGWEGGLKVADEGFVGEEGMEGWCRDVDRRRDG